MKTRSFEKLFKFTTKGMYFFVYGLIKKKKVNEMVKKTYPNLSKFRLEIFLFSDYSKIFFPGFPLDDIYITRSDWTGVIYSLTSCEL